MLYIFVLIMHKYLDLELFVIYLFSISKLYNTIYNSNINWRPKLHDHIRHAHKGKLLLGTSSLIPSSPLSNPLLALATPKVETPPTKAPEVAAAAVRLVPNPYK